MSGLKFGFTAQQIIEKGLIAQQDIDKVKNWVLEESMLPKLTEEQLALFVIGQQNNFSAIQKTIKAFYRVRLDGAEFFEQRSVNIPEMERMIETVDFCIMPEKTDEGYVVLYTRLADSQNLKLDPGILLKLVGMVFDAAVYDYPSQGIVLVYDMVGASIMHLTLLRPRLMKIYFKYLQECLPVPIKEVHVINCLYFLDKLMVIINPFLNKETLGKIHFHTKGMNMEEFYDKVLPKRCLPKELGGSSQEIQVLRGAVINRLLEMEEHFAVEEQQRNAKHFQTYTPGKIF